MPLCQHRRHPFAAFRFPLSAFRPLPFAPLIACATLLLSAGELAAQNVTIQQPTISTFSGGTTISVPDRGRAVLGGVGSAATSRSTYGPLRLNTNYGSAYEGSTASVHAWIHDFSELDRQALDAADGRNGRDDDRQPVSRADHAWRHLSDRSAATRSSGAATAPAARDVTATRRQARSGNASERGSLSADELYQRGMKAEAAGQRGVALAFLRVARDRGSAAAERELELIDASGKPKRVQKNAGVDAADSPGGAAPRSYGGAR